MTSPLEFELHLKKNYPELKFQNFDSVFMLWQFPIEYKQFLELQEYCTEIVKKNNLKILICCNHKTLVTDGQGDRQNAHLNLNPIIDPSLPYYKIKRGGGVTLHHENQWIFYPIVKLDSTNWTLTYHLGWMMAVVKNILREFDLNVENKRNPLGIWVGDKKIASVGVGVNRFVSNHGLALNISMAAIEQSTFSKLNPCGLNSSIYSSVNDFRMNPITIYEFHEKFLKLIGQKVQLGLHQLVSNEDCHLD